VGPYLTLLALSRATDQAELLAPIDAPAAPATGPPSA
jgi:hypothetical protein